MATQVWAEEKPKNHPLVTPLEGSEIYHQQKTNFGEYKLALGVVKDKKISKTTPLVGKLTMTTYEGKEENSTFEIYMLMKERLLANNFEILFECSKSDCKNKFSGYLYKLNPYQIDRNYGQSIPLTNGNSDFEYYLAAKTNYQGKPTYLTLFATHGWGKKPLYRIDVIEEKSLSGATTPKSSQMLSDLEKYAKLSDLNVEFAPKKAEIKDLPEKYMTELKKLLDENSNINLLVVSHCSEFDNYEQNHELSVNRAQALVDKMANKYGISKTRIKAVGAGEISPLSGKNKKLNTRIEIVKSTGALAKTSKLVKSKSTSSKKSELPDLKEPTRPNLPDYVPEFEIIHSASLAAQAQKEGKEVNIIPEGPDHTATIQEPEPRKPDMVTVPNVIGKFKIKAKNILQKSGFALRISGKKIGKVTKQSLKPGSKVIKGSLIKLTIGK
jgi:OOP family OmpA-OmpF porin